MSALLCAVRRLAPPAVVACAALCGAAAWADAIHVADPSIYHENGTNYLVGTEGPVCAALPQATHAAFPILFSAGDAAWRPLTTAAGESRLLSKSVCFGRGGFWAPHLFRHGNRYCFAYTSDTHWGIATAERIEGPYAPLAAFTEGRGQIDPYVFFDEDGKAYAVMSDWNLGGLSVVEMTPDLKGWKGKPRLCVVNDQPWEKRPLEERYVQLNKKFNYGTWDAYHASLGTVEGPTLMKRHGKYVLFYSANDFRSPDYCVGVAVADSVFGPWKKLQGGPVLSRDVTKLNGTGHGDVYFENGDMWYVFHFHDTPERISPRRTGAIRLVETVGADGFPRYAPDAKSQREFSAPAHATQANAPCIDGIYPHLAMQNDEGECGTGAVVPWAGSLWVVTYGPHCPVGSSDKLYQIMPDLMRVVRKESVGGTSANRLIHRETNQLLIGPYVIDAQGNVRVVAPAKMPGRLTGAGRHLADPAHKVYVATMETGLYELDMETLAVRTLIRESGKNDAAIELCLMRLGLDWPADWATAPRTRVPGYHAKGLCSGFGRVFVSNNGEDSEAARRDPFVRSGVLADWSKPGEDWRAIFRCQFTDITTADGIYGNEHPATNPIWTLGWDAKSVILAVTTNGVAWQRYRLPKASHCYDGAHGWNTEWPRIREAGLGGDDLLATMHGTFWRFPKTFSPASPNGIRPISTYLKVVGDFCYWKDAPNGGSIVFGCDDHAKCRFLGKRTLKADQAPNARSTSNLWFVKPQDLASFGPATGEGWVWRNENVKNGDVSEPYLWEGYATREFTFTDASGHGVPHELIREGDWVRVKARADAKGASAHFVYGPAKPAALPPLDAKQPYVEVADDNGKVFRFPNVNGDTHVLCREVATERDLLYVGGVFYEVPAENAGGFAVLRPIALADEPVRTIAVDRGLILVNGKRMSLDALWRNGTAAQAHGLWRAHFAPVREEVREEVCVTKSFSVSHSADVLVVGGGPAGVSAAVTAAEAGRSVLLVEQTGSFGGAGTVGGVAEHMNFDDGEHFLAGGFGRRVFDALYRPEPLARRCYNVKAEDVKRLYDRLVGASGAKFLFYTRLVDVVMRDGRVTHALVSGPDGTKAVSAKVFVDATGSGFLCRLAGVPSDYGNAHGVPMASTLCSVWGGVDFARKGVDGRFAKQAWQDGVLSQYDTCLPGIKMNYPEVGVGFGNVGHLFGVDDRDSASLTKAMVDGRRQLAEYETYYRRYVPGCEKATLIRTADMLGVRASRRIRCEKTLTIDAFHAKGRFADEIGRYSYPIDIHPETADKKGMAAFSKAISMRHGKGESYSIPYGALIPVGVANVLVAGRSIGADNAMQASVRVIPGCYITGQAAGMAAALAVDHAGAVREVSTDMLRSRLRKVGAYLSDDSAPLIP